MSSKSKQKQRESHKSEDKRKHKGDRQAQEKTGAHQSANPETTKPAPKKNPGAGSNHSTKHD